MAAVTGNNEAHKSHSLGRSAVTWASSGFPSRLRAMSQATTAADGADDLPSSPHPHTHPSPPTSWRSIFILSFHMRDGTPLPLFLLPLALPFPLPSPFSPPSPALPLPRTRLTQIHRRAARDGEELIAVL